MKTTTYNPKKLRKKKKEGFLKKARTKAGRNTIKRRRQRGRKKLTA